MTARVLALETEHKVQLALLQTELKEEMNLLRIENRNLHEKLQHEIGLREDLEKASGYISRLQDTHPDPCVTVLCSVHSGVCHTAWRGVTLSPACNWGHSLEPRAGLWVGEAQMLSLSGSLWGFSFLSILLA